MSERASERMSESARECDGGARAHARALRVRRSHVLTVMFRMAAAARQNRARSQPRHSPYTRSADASLCYDAFSNLPPRTHSSLTRHRRFVMFECKSAKVPNSNAPHSKMPEHLRLC
eukprot:3437195-Pleurochrysis_carterae.AAC.1